MNIFQWVFTVATFALLGIPILRYARVQGVYRFLPPCPKIRSVSYSPFATITSTDKMERLALEVIERELGLLASHVQTIRTYSSSGVQSRIPAIAEKLGLMVSLGVWLSDDHQKNEIEIQQALTLIKAHKNITRIIIGNECLLRHDVSPAQLMAYLDQVRKEVTIPVTTAEVWHSWLANPALVKHVDEISAHFLPFWEGFDSQSATDYILHAISQLQQHYPDQKIYVGEAGWPSSGHILNGIPSDPYQQAEHIRNLVHRLELAHIDYNIIEAFDQPWKTIEGTVGRHWGIYTARGKPKFVIGPKQLIPNVSKQVFIYHFFRSVFGKYILGAFLVSLIAVLSETVYSHLAAELWPAPVLMTVCWVGWLAVVLITVLHETIERYLMPRPPRWGEGLKANDNQPFKISIHLACKNEPPEMVMATLTRLSEVAYGDSKYM